MCVCSVDIKNNAMAAECTVTMKLMDRWMNEYVLTVSQMNTYSSTVDC